MGDVRLMMGDCIERMKEIESGSVDLIAAITTDRPFRWVMHKSLSVAVSNALYNET
jgi:hypothetical protein